MAGGFDISQFFSPFRGDPLAGHKMQLEAKLEGMRNTTQAARVLQEGLQQRRQDAMMRQQLGLRAQQLESLDRARTDAALRGHQRLGLDREKFELDQRKYQGGVDAEAVQALMSPFRRGDLNALEAARAAAVAKDPSLNVQLPGERAPSVPDTPDSMTFTLDEAYPEDVNKLRVRRGDRSLLELDKAQAQQNEQDLYGAAVAGFAKSPFAAMYAPAIEGAMGAAGHGATGAEAAENAAKMATGERDALLRREGHEAMLGARGAQREAAAQQREFQQSMAMHRAIEGISAQYKDQVKAIDGDDAQLQNISRQIASDSAWQQNSALAENILRISGKAASDREMLEQQSRDGQWTRLAKIARGWTDGGRLPPELAAEVRESTDALLAANRARRMQLGLRARDRVYTSSELPFGDEEQTVRAGAQVFAAITGEVLTPEEIAQETARLRRARGMAGGAPSPSLPAGAPPLGAGADIPIPDASGEFVPSDPAVRDDPRLLGDGGVGARLRGAAPPGHLGNQHLRPSQVPLVPQQPPTEEDEAAELLRQLEAL